MPNLIKIYLSMLMISTLTDVVTCDCTKINSCSCENSDGTVVDLSPLAKNDGSPQFVDVPDQQTTDTFSWNPCNDFTEGSCSGVAVCQTRQAIPNPLYFNCGTQDSADFLINEKGQLMLQYSAESPDTLRTTNIVLICDQSQAHDLTVTGEQGTLAIYDMELKSKYACPGSGSGTSSGSLSAGWILVIVFISITALYFFIGFGYQVGVRKKRGVESIPNSEFWTGLPSTIKAGVVFTVQRGKVQSYDNL